MVKLSAKCIVTGDSSVGKSALIQLFRSNGSHFLKNYTMTTSMDVVMKTVLIPDTGDSVELFLCDTPGKAMFYDMTEMLWDQPGVLCVVFDITNEISFSNCIKWLQKVKTKTSTPHVPGVLVGNKTDLSACRTVTKTEAQELAMKHGLEYFETSVKELENFEQPFQALAKAFYHMYHERVENFKSLV
ncbi:intraflagellar transport protein 27 homolog isoform X2 [Spea bombifrons]|uniref:intraflagellar transport protein 27 homolog isoform X2 n=1 Tax=Spea bombifrons TaxID=233779 RepID=UPI00234A121D|nr:intraflagellar transport protein 27 homolog isoform X2 [Spea bombifrons]